MKMISGNEVTCEPSESAGCFIVEGEVDHLVRLPDSLATWQLGNLSQAT